jgi:molybdopterin-containing oxidoreductase family iron-sulfur binding subunit
MKTIPPTEQGRSADIPVRSKVGSTTGVQADEMSGRSNVAADRNVRAPETGRRYWQSLDQLAETPEFRQWVEKEFPAGASEWSDPVSRRHFVRIMSASFLLGGLGFAAGGCRRPEQKILPFSKMPENYVHGVPQYYATAMPTRGGAIPLVVKSNDGRPTKIEGNALHPDSNGGTDRYAQASILNLYDPDRAARVTFQGNSKSPEAANDFLADLSKKAQSNGGQGLAFLIERNTSPSRLRLQKLISEKFPQARWYVHEPVDLDIHRRAASQAFGQSVKPYYKFEAAKVIVSLDCDFLGSEEDVANNIRRFAQGRRIEKPSDSLNRLYVIESLMSLTGFNADHRLRCASTLVEQVAMTLVQQILKGEIAPASAGAKLPGVDPKWISECAKDLVANAGQSLVVAGHRQPLFVHSLAHAINSALGNLGKTVMFHSAPEYNEGSIADLAKALNSSQVETLVILGGNPVYTAPADLAWATTQRKAKTVVRLGYYEPDETSSQCDWHFPASHYLESWGDALTSDGTLVPIQPLIAPLFGGVTELEVLARVAGANLTSPYDIVRETFAGSVKENTEEQWKKFLHDGFQANSAAQPVGVKFESGLLKEVATALNGKPAVEIGKNKLEIVFFRDYSLDDGRYANNGWLQEMPDPVTKMVWDNAVLISRKTAHELEVKNSDVVEVKLGNRTVRGPIWVQPGMADYSLGLALGYGQEKAGRVGRSIGFNAYPLRSTEAQNIAVGATIRPLGQKYVLATTNDHWSMEGRPIIREVNLDQYRAHPDFVKAMNMEAPPVVASLYPNPLDEPKTHGLNAGLHQWGMSIDLNACVGCSACMMACQSENNVPIVGKDQVKRGREMHWLRIDRYYAGNKNVQEFPAAEADQQFQQWIDDPQVVTQPMLCQHCEAAPCESVCPVNATVHNEEGLNLMVYNRCVGTRYCSNNCPYKVRRFNFFDFNKRPLNKLYWGPLATRPEEELELVKMIKNPDVTVRMRGVMEKCTFCVQRIEQARIAQKVKAGASGDVIVPSDSFTTACAQACPAGAIVFGNLNDPESRVSKLKKQDRDYSVLEYLLTKPRLTYLARVRNPNPAMPDYQPEPLSFQEFEKKMGNPFESEAVEKKGAE